MKYFYFLCLAFLAGCNPKASIDSLPDAKNIASDFFSGFKSENYEQLDALYSKEFWTTMPKETWHKILPNVRHELGAIKTCELATWNQSAQASTEGTGNFVTLQYNCIHEKYDSIITFTTVKPLSGGETKIIGQHFNSIGLLIE